MSKFVKLIPALALAAALSPLAANAHSQSSSPKAAYAVSSATASQQAANSKGRPAEFTPTQSGQVAVNAKGRPSELPPNQVADNSKGRPGENNAPQYETPIG